MGKTRIAPLSLESGMANADDGQRSEFRQGDEAIYAPKAEQRLISSIRMSRQATLQGSSSTYVRWDIRSRGPGAEKWSWLGGERWGRFGGTIMWAGSDILTNWGNNLSNAACLLANK
jgi:hypothetical protein